MTSCGSEPNETAFGLYLECLSTLGHGVERERCDHCLCVCAVRAWLEGGGTQQTPQTGGRAHTLRLHAVEAVADANHRRPPNRLFLCMHGVGGKEMVDPKQRDPVPAPRNNRNDTGKMGVRRRGEGGRQQKCKPVSSFFFVPCVPSRYICSLQ
mgnify:CR=1 FL=1